MLGFVSMNVSNHQHLADYMAATEGAVEEFILNEMTNIA